MDDDDRGAEATPCALPDAGLKRGRLLFTMEVDGEVFDVRGHAGGIDYDWVSGRNEDYGFGSSFRAEDLSQDAHEESIRSFLSMIDPDTGYIADA
jgi:hypothetical protein